MINSFNNNYHLHLKIIYGLMTTLILIVLSNSIFLFYLQCCRDLSQRLPNVNSIYYEQEEWMEKEKISHKQKRVSRQIQDGEINDLSEVKCVSNSNKNISGRSGTKQDEDLIKITDDWFVDENVIKKYCFSAENVCREKCLGIRGISGVKGEKDDSGDRNDSGAVEEKGILDLFIVNGTPGSSGSKGCVITKYDSTLWFSYHIYGDVWTIQVDPLENDEKEWSFWHTGNIKEQETKIGLYQHIHPKDSLEILFKRNYTSHFVYDVEGYGNIMYKGSFFYYAKNSAKIVKFNTFTNETKTMDIGLLMKNTFLFVIDPFANNDTRMQFVSNEKGLWLVLPTINSRICCMIKIDPESLNSREINFINLDRNKLGKIFFDYDTLYAVEVAKIINFDVTFSVTDLYGKSKSTFEVSAEDEYRREYKAITYNWKTKRIYISFPDKIFRRDLTFECPNK